MEGEQTSVPTVGALARGDAPTCLLEEKVGEARNRAREAGLDRCVVVNAERIVLGVLREPELASNPEATAEEVMRSGPTTVRPDEPLVKLTERMRGRGTPAVLVTTPDGKLTGILLRDDAERAT